MSVRPSSGTRATIGIRWIPIVASFAILVGALSYALLARDDDPTATLVNETGGYQLDYPATWKTASVRSTTTFVSPERDVVVGVGRAPKGGLDAAAERFRTATLATYEDVEIDGRDRRPLAERDAILFAGSAVNETGQQLRWLTVTVDAGETNFGIWVFASEGSDPNEVLPHLQQLVSSFRPLA